MKKYGEMERKLVIFPKNLLFDNINLTLSDRRKVALIVGIKKKNKEEFFFYLYFL